MTSMAAAEACRLLSVSRETSERLEIYAALLCKWQQRINLVSGSTLADLWRRHMLDSGQLFRYLPTATRVVVDLGSGAGFPGLVLAAMGVPEVHLVESDVRKCAFLREAARAMAVPVTVHTARIEKVAPFSADVVTSRALAPLSELLDYAAPFFLHPEDRAKPGECLFLKGRTGEDELTVALKEWNMVIERHTSLSDPDGLILRLSEVSRGPTAGRRRR